MNEYEILNGQSAGKLRGDELALAKNLCAKLFINSANMLNDYQSISEKALIQKLRDEYNFAIGTGTIHRWRVDGKWDEQLKASVALAVVEDDSLQKALKNSTLKEAVRNTEVSIERNNTLLAAGYELAEIELLDLKNKRASGAPLSKDEFFRFFNLTKLFAERDDRMKDRLAMMASNAVDAKAVLNQLEAIDVELED